MGLSGRFTHVVIILDYLGQVSYMCCIWVELPVQRILCSISEVASGNPTSTCIPRVDG